MSNEVKLPYEYIPDPAQGRPISGGSIYIGVPDGDPANVVGDRVAVSVRQEDGSEVAISQPVSTSAGGIPVYNGSTVTLLISEATYSIAVLNSLGSQQYYQAQAESLFNRDDVGDAIGGLTEYTFATVASMQALTTISGIVVSVENGYKLYVAANNANYIVTESAANGFGDHSLVGGKTATLNEAVPSAEQYGISITGALSDDALLAAVTALQGKALRFNAGEYNFSVFPAGLDGIKLLGEPQTLTWTDFELPVYGGIFTGGKDTALVAGVIRYYTSGTEGAGWYFLSDQGLDHDPILIGPVTASGNFSLILKVNIEDFGLDRTLWTPSGVVVGPDETYAGQGVIVGGSVGTDEITIAGSMAVNEPIDISWSGSAWTQPTGYTVTWEVDRVRITRDSDNRRNGISASRNAMIIQPRHRGTGTQVMKMPVNQVSADAMDVFFFDSDGVLITVESQNMRFYMTDPYAPSTVFNWGAVSENQFGNIWIFGSFVRKS